MSKQVKVALSQFQREHIIKLIPKIANEGQLTPTTGKWVFLSIDEAKAILDGIQKNIQPNPYAEAFALESAARLLSDAIDDASGIHSIPKGKRIYQFKITLLDYKPSIWRRIQINSGTLDKLHEHIQNAMGWTNSHLHEFIIGGERYGDPNLLGDDFDAECQSLDSTTTKIEAVIPRSGARFTFHYEYDFGDGWRHEVLFEGCLEAEQGVRYPVCLEGENACPPEDVGGVRGYARYLDAITNPHHEDHVDMLMWGGKFDPKFFDPEKTTRKMRRGIFDWRKVSLE